MNINAFKEKIIWSFWTGDNEMSAVRRHALFVLRETCGCNNLLITPDFLKEFEVEDDPFHEGYPFLSFTHRSDYLRSYFMYHYGGAYSDIKPYSFDWNPYFAQLEESDKDFIGAQEACEEHVASDDPLIRQAYNKLASVTVFIYKPKSPFAKLWKDATKVKMDSILEELRLHDGSYHPRAVSSGAMCDPSVEGRGYPLEWSELLGSLLHPLQYHNQEKYLTGIPQQGGSEELYR